jgi:Xaa-Pro dipeptidase
LTTYTKSETDKGLLEAQAKAEHLFRETEQRGLIRIGVTERELSDQVYQLAQELFGIRKYWHKRIVRAGVNTLCPYRENPPDLKIQSEDLVFFDFGPVFEEWEADFGRTYLLGNDVRKRKMIDDLEIVFEESKLHFRESPEITGRELFEDVVERSERHGWKYGGPHAGHLLGIFPHEIRLGECGENYICTDNNKRMRDPDINGEPRHWILEVHLVDVNLKYGAFYEQLLTL